MNFLSLFVLLFLLFSPYSTFAAVVDATDITLILPGDGSTYTLSTAVIDSISIGSNDFTFDVPGGGSFELISPDKKKLDNDQSVSTNCRTNDSVIFFSVASGGASKTIKVTPTGTCTVAATSGGGSPSLGSGGGGGGGGAAAAPPPVPSTQTVSKVAQLKESITELQTKISQKLGQKVPGISISPEFTQNLTRGMSSGDVRRLQMLLAADKEIYPEGITNGYFGTLTENAVRRFQLKYGIIKNSTDPGNGRFGPVTRAKLGEVFKVEKAVVEIPAVPPPAPVPPPATPPAAPAAISAAERQSLIAAVREKIQELTAKLLQLQVKLIQEKINALKK